MHSAVLAADHFGELIQELVCTNKNCKNAMTGFKCHRTKCGAIIENIIASSLKEELKEDLHETPYAILIDEWTDCTVTPHLAVAIMHYSRRIGSISASFLGLKELKSANSESIFASLKELLDEFGLDPNYCVGYGSDGASVVSGKNNSVYTRIREMSPNVVQFKCICHSLQKVVEKSFEELPLHISKLLHKIPKWFSKSFYRRAEYTQLAESFEFAVKESNLPFKKYAETRWLCRGKVASAILANWDPLLHYFKSIVEELKLNQKYEVKALIEILSNKDFRYVFEMIVPIIDSFEKANKLFQSNFTDPIAAVEEINSLRHSVSSRIFDINGSLKDIKMMDYGYRFKADEVSQYVLEK